MLLLNILTLFTLACGVIWIYHKITKKILHKYAEFFGSMFPILFVIIALRAFAIELFRIPSSSMVPNLLIGDLILVSKYDYGLKLPLTRQTIFAWSTPQRGEIVVFASAKENMDMIKCISLVISLLWYSLTIHQLGERFLGIAILLIGLSKVFLMLKDILK